MNKNVAAMCREKLRVGIEYGRQVALYMTLAGIHNINSELEDPLTDDQLGAFLRELEPELMRIWEEFKEDPDYPLHMDVRIEELRKKYGLKDHE